MRIEQLEFLIEISHHSSLSSASTKLHITPQSLSRSISSIENEIGVKLLDRSTHGVTFTEKGVKFVDSAKKMVAEYYDVLTQINPSLQSLYHNPTSNLQGEFTIYAHQIFSASILPSILSEFSTHYPHIRISLLDGINKQILDILHHTDSQTSPQCIGLITLPISSSDLYCQDICDFIPFFKGKYCACVSKNNPLAHQKLLSLKTLLQYPLISFCHHENTDDMLLSQLLEQYGSKKSAFCCNSITPWIHAIINNIGIGLIYDIVLSDNSSIKNDLKNVVIIPLEEKLELVSGLLIPHTYKSSEPIKSFLDFFMANYAINFSL